MYWNRDDIMIEDKTEIQRILTTATFSGPKSCNPAASDFFQSDISLRTLLKMSEVKILQAEKLIRAAYAIPNVKVRVDFFS
jgi:hypothetical protein